MYEKYGLFIDGAWRAASDGSTAEVSRPVSEQPLGQAPSATPTDTACALDAAERGLVAWRSVGGFARAASLHQVADEMVWRQSEAARMLSTETGKPLAQSEREWALAVDQFRWYAEEARRIYGRIVESRVPGGRFEISREPVGIVGAFTAWNFPAALASKASGKRAALHCGTAEYAARAIGWGFDMCTVSGDFRLMAGAAAASVRQFRELCGDSGNTQQRDAHTDYTHTDYTHTDYTQTDDTKTSDAQTGDPQISDAQTGDPQISDTRGSY